MSFFRRADGTIVVQLPTISVPLSGIGTHPLPIGPRVAPIPLVEPPKVQQYYVYILRSLVSTKTYVGFSVDPQHRLRQHNGELVGGAKRTLRGRPWKIVCYLTGFADKHTALQCEWIQHHPSGVPGRVGQKRDKRIRGRGIPKGIAGRLQILKRILLYDKFTATAPLTQSLNLTLVWLENYGHLNVPYIREIMS